MAIRHNRYNAKALVNKGNCLFMSKEYERAKEIFLEAIGVEVSNNLPIAQHCAVHVAIIQGWQPVCVASIRRG